MASLRKTYFKKSQKELQLSHNNVTFLSGDFSLSCGATANLPPWSAVVKVNLDFFYTIRVQASDLLNILTGQSPGRICLSIGSCSLHTTLCSSGTHLDKLNFLCSCYKLDKLVNLFHLVATLHKRNCFLQHFLIVCNYQVKLKGEFSIHDLLFYPSTTSTFYPSTTSTFYPSTTPSSIHPYSQLSIHPRPPLLSIHNLNLLSIHDLNLLSIQDLLFYPSTTSTYINPQPPLISIHNLYFPSRCGKSTSRSPLQTKMHRSSGTRRWTRTFHRGRTPQ